MKVFILAATLALAQACTDNPAAKCGTTDQVCPGGIDPMGCAMPDFCVPADSKYPKKNVHLLTKSFTEFFLKLAFCPAMCSAEEIMCPGKIKAITARLLFVFVTSFYEIFFFLRKNGHGFW